MLWKPRKEDWVHTVISLGSHPISSIHLSIYRPVHLQYLYNGLFTYLSIHHCAHGVIKNLRTSNWESHLCWVGLQMQQVSNWEGREAFQSLVKIFEYLLRPGGNGRVGHIPYPIWLFWYSPTGSLHLVPRCRWCPSQSPGASCGRRRAPRWRRWPGTWSQRWRCPRRGPRHRCSEPLHGTHRGRETPSHTGSIEHAAKELLKRRSVRNSDNKLSSYGTAENKWIFTRQDEMHSRTPINLRRLSFIMN